jgi:hypothetical protein
MRTERTAKATGTLLVAALVVVAGACVHGGGSTAGSSTTTTEPGGSTTTTGPGGGEVAAGDECGEPPIWAITKSHDVRAVDESSAVDPVDVDTVDTDADDVTTDDPGADDAGESGGGFDEPTDADEPGSDSDEPADADEPGSDAEDDEGPGGSEECEPTTEPELGTGDVQITLRWESDADLDLHVVEPNGEEIWYSEPGPTSTGGQLDVDSNVGCENDGSVENVFWPQGDMPLGEYTVTVVGFSVDGCGGGDYTVTASVEGQEVLNETGSVGEDEEDVYSFDA